MIVCTVYNSSTDDGYYEGGKQIIINSFQDQAQL